MIDTDAVVGGEAASCFMRVVVAKLPVAGVRALAEAAQVGGRAVSGVQGVPVVIRRRFGQDEAEEVRSSRRRMREMCMVVCCVKGAALSGLS